MRKGSELYNSQDERSLAFADRCDREWGLGLVWIEGVVDPRHGHGTRHRLVSFETAARRGEPFEAVIGKYGLPGPGYLHCTRETKLAPITSYLRSIGWEAGTYDTAIGYRADEIDRQHPKAAQLGFVYPLIRVGMTKADVIDWWRQQPFNLYVPEHLGNCRWCWKKSLRKHLTLARDYPGVFDFPARMEADHALTNATDGQPRKLFRRRQTVADIRALAKEPFEPFVDGNEAFDPDLDVVEGCGESCEIDMEAV